MTTAYINQIATGVPPYEVHGAFVGYALSLFDKNARSKLLLQRMIERSGIERRYSCLAPAPDCPNGSALDTDSLYIRGRPPDTAARMRVFETRAPELAADTVNKLELGRDRAHVTHLLITSCTGLSAPGVDIEIIARCGLPSSVERTIIGFMGCYAAINALRLARHIVRSDPKARVLIVNVELCTLHLRETTDIPQLLCFLLFSDGCAASLVTSERTGIALESFKAILLPDTRGLMAWNIGSFGFDMLLSGQVPSTICDALRARSNEILGSGPDSSIDMWAVHAGGRTVLDAVERGLNLRPHALSVSREILRRYGNMSSATVMFVLSELMHSAVKRANGYAISFGPGLVAETMSFRMAS